MRLIRSRSRRSTGIRTLHRSSARELSIRPRWRSRVRSTAARRILQQQTARPPASGDRRGGDSLAIRRLRRGGTDRRHYVAAIIALKTAIYFSRFNYH